jgi:hypothetical protein
MVGDKSSVISLTFKRSKRGSIKIGSSWGDERWQTYERTTVNKYKYKITGICTIKTALGMLNCYKVES